MQRFVYTMNIVGLVVLMAPIVGAFRIQLTGDMPCPLCLLQRIAMFIMAIGAMFNLRFGIQRSNYGYVLLGAVLGLLMSTRQVLLHICETPGSGYGGSVMGMHLYTWAFIIFLCFIVAVAVFLMLGGEQSDERSLNWENCWPARGICYFVLAMAAVNVIATFMECGPFECPDNPTGYWMFGG